MRRVKRISCRVPVLLALVAMMPVLAHSQLRAKESLRGLSGVYVHVLPLGKDIEAGGLSKSQVQSAVETALKQAGIRIYERPQLAEGSANLGIVIDTVKHPQGPIIYTVEVSVIQEVHLARRREPDPFPAQTWAAKALGLTSPNRMDVILEPLRAKVSEFIDAYLDVNTKP